MKPQIFRGAALRISGDGVVNGRQSDAACLLERVASPPFVARNAVSVGIPDASESDVSGRWISRLRILR